MIAAAADVEHRRVIHGKERLGTRMCAYGFFGCAPSGTFCSGLPLSGALGADAEPAPLPAELAPGPIAAPAAAPAPNPSAGLPPVEVPVEDAEPLVAVAVAPGALASAFAGPDCAEVLVVAPPHAATNKTMTNLLRIPVSVLQ